MDAEDIIQLQIEALLPIYDRGNVTMVFTGDGGELVIRKTCKTVLRNLAKCCNTDLMAARKNCGQIVNKKLQVPIPLLPMLLLLPVKFRENPLGKNDGTLGYLNFYQIKNLSRAKGGKSKITFYSEREILVPITFRTMKEYFKNARLVETLSPKQTLSTQQGAGQLEEETASGVSECIYSETENAIKAYVKEAFAEILRLK